MALKTRRGSSSAPDPFNVHASFNLDPNRTCTSTLLITKAADEPKRRSDSANRLSFAFSSFSGPTLPSRLNRSPSSKLSPDQVLDLARQAANPAHSFSSHGFTPLPDDIYLPFIDRPSEVASLISSPPDIRLFALIAQSFSLHDRQVVHSDHLPRDPSTWSYHQLVHHLTKVDRDVAPDFIWSIAARKCILSHSELLWERVKGALGVPPELDVDYDFLEDNQPSPKGSDNGDLPPENLEESVSDFPVTPPAVHHESDPDPDSTVSIEPLLPSSTANVNAPGSLGENTGLGDIAEGAEEEDEDEEEEKESNLSKTGSTTNVQVPPDPFDGLLPSQIQGLRISTTPHSSSFVSTPPLAGTATTAHLPQNSAPVSAHSRTSSVSSLVGPFRRSESTGTLSSLWHASSQAGVFFSGSDSGEGFDEKDDKMQGMGPMFPGNFSRLGAGLARSGSSSSMSSVKLPHARYIAPGLVTPPSVEAKSLPVSPKFRSFSHIGGQRPFVPSKQRRQSLGSASAEIGMNSLNETK